MKYFNPKKIVLKLSEVMVCKKTNSGSRIQGYKRHRIPDPDPQHCPQELYSKWHSKGIEREAFGQKHRAISHLINGRIQRHERLGRANISVSGYLYSPDVSSRAPHRHKINLETGAEVEQKKIVLYSYVVDQNRRGSKYCTFESRSS